MLFRTAEMLITFMYFCSFILYIVQKFTTEIIIKSYADEWAQNY